MGKLIVVRHGETNFNIEQRYTGQTDISLNEKGLLQAKLTASKLKDIPIDIVISSTLKRAKETAGIINEELALPMIYSEDLIEICMGVYEGLTKEEVQIRYPEMWSNNSPEGREDLLEVERRVFQRMDFIRNEYSDKNVLVVTHGYIAKVINKYFKHTTGDAFKQFVLHNCEFVEYDFQDITK